VESLILGDFIPFRYMSMFYKLVGKTRDGYIFLLNNGVLHIHVGASFSLALKSLNINVAATVPALDVNSSKLECRRIRTGSNENVVVVCSRQNVTVDVVHEDVGDVDAFRRYAGRATVH
jgi:hypothetical protein